MVPFKVLSLILSKGGGKNAIKLNCFGGALTEDEMYGVGVQHKRCVMHSYTWPTPGRGQALIYPYTPLCKGPLGSKNIGRDTP